MELIVKPRNEEELRLVQSVLNRMRIKNQLGEKELKKRRKKEFLDSLEERVLELNKAQKGEIELKNAFDLLDEF